MEIKTIASLATTMAHTATQQAVSISVMKKAMDMQATSAAAMLEMLPPVAGTSLPPHLGQHVNTTA